MPVQLTVMERRDNADRDSLARTALEGCRLVRSREGIRSSKFYWYGFDTIVFVTEGEAEALNSPGAANPAEYAKLGFALGDMARSVLNWRLIDARTGEESYRQAGR